MKNFIKTITLLLFLSAICLITSSDAMAQFRPSIDVQEWPSGKIVLTSGDTLYGPVTFYRTQEVINVQNEDGTISSFSPVNVQYF
ncbi:MAG: hypothetical protein LPK03_15095, partial [Pontibacter sp.]|nr:hypothetical protein [Pontibacter sp.]